MGFFERMRREVQERGSFSIPNSLSQPCPFCPTYQAWMNEIQDVHKIRRLKQDCMRTCEHVSYYDLYGINGLKEPMTSECDFLIVWINELVEKYSNGEKLTAEEAAQLRVWGPRLSLVVAMEEAKVAAAMSALESISWIEGK